MIKEYVSIEATHDFTLKDENGYTIARYATKTLDPKSGKLMSSVIAMGENLPVAKNISYVLYGVWEYNPKYKAPSFKVSFFKAIVPSESENIIKYLSSGVIKGCRKGIATKIVKAFGDRSFEVLRSDDAVEQLSKIKGISKKKAEKLVSNFIANDSADTIFKLSSKYNIDVNISKKIYEKFNDKCFSVIDDNPYKLCSVEGISFTTADCVAINNNYDLNSMERIQSGIEFILQRALFNGNLYCPLKQLIANSKKLLDYNAKKIDISTDTIYKVIEQMIKNQKVVSRKGSCIYLKSIDDIESKLAKNVLRVASPDPCTFNNKDVIRTTANKVFEKFHMNPSPSQMDAVITSLSNSLTIVTGGPGVGKTTVIKAIIESFNRIYGNESNIVLAAPTGRAARRMTESCGYPSQTLHKLLRLKPTEIESESNNESFVDEIEADLLIVDEFSMVDTFLANHLFKAIGNDTKVVIVGDIDQLPSVGPGLVLKELIDAKIVPTIRLKSVFRQSETSSIYINAQKILNGDTNLVFDNNFFFIETNSEEKTADTVARSYKKLLKTHDNNPDNVQVLTPRREKVATSAEFLNSVLRDIANSNLGNTATMVYKGITYCVNDKVMHVKKNTDTVSNGDIGYISDIISSDGEMVVLVDFGDGRKEEYYKDDMEYLIHAYASTIHKSQGSEYDVVIIPVFDGDGSCQKLLNCNLIYTAITRAKNTVVIIGSKADLNTAIVTKSEIKRNTLLAERIINNYNILHANDKKYNSSKKIAG